MISFDEFSKVELRVGTVMVAEAVEGSEKLIKTQVDFGELGTKQILSGLRPFYKPEQLVGKQFVYVVNLESRKIMGLESEGMILAAGEEKPVPIKPSKKVAAGSKLH